MTKKNSTGSSNVDVLDDLLQRYEDASVDVQAQKTVIKAYGNIAEISAIADIVATRKNLLLLALEEQASIGEKVVVQFTTKVKKLEELNKDLTEEKTRINSDLKRLKLEYHRQIGLLPKKMRSAQKPKDQHKEDTLGGNQNTPCSDTDSIPKKRGAPKGHRGNSRAIPSEIHIQREEITPSQCNCGCCAIMVSEETDTKYIEDILPVCSQITKVTYKRGICTNCGSLVRHEDALHGPPSSIGPNLSAHLTMLRQMGVTYRKLAYFCTETLGIPLSPSGVLGVVSRSAETLRPANEEIFSAVRKQTVLNADETGWPIANKSAYIWGFFNTNLAYFHSDKSRGAKVPKAILGENFKGTVLCDFYASYNFLKKKQRCWIHLLRDIANERKVLPGSVSLQKFETRAWNLVQKGVEISKLDNGDQKTKQINHFNKKLLSISKMKLPKGKASVLAKRIGKHYSDLARFLSEPGVEYHNNRAERQLRPLVISRKNSYGSNTPLGAERTCIINTVIETCRLNGIRPIDWLKQVFQAPNCSHPSPFLKK